MSYKKIHIYCHDKSAIFLVSGKESPAGKAIINV